MKLAILGGSFNPVHTGHLMLADAALSEAGYDRVVLIPAFESPFKSGADGASPRDRLEMLAASIAGNPRLTVDDCELRREGVSYTIDTLIDIIERYKPGARPGFIMGDDLAAAFYKWRKPDEIAARADFIIARRESRGALESFPYPYRALDNEVVNIASRRLREKISTGGAWRYFVPEGARCIIEDRKLYGFTASPGEESDAACAADGGQTHAADGVRNSAGETGGARPRPSETATRVENDIRANLNLDRFLHSRNTALLAWDLCRRFGIDPRKGYLAGIAHDMCKGMGSDALTRLARADGGSISKLEQKKPDLLHARAAAVLLPGKYGIDDKDIIEAIRYHTTGNYNMGALAKVIYVADKIEISRTKVDPGLRKMSASADLETLFSAVLSNTVSYLKSRQMDISYGTKKLLAAIQTRNNP